MAPQVVFNNSRRETPFLHGSSAENAFPQHKRVQLSVGHAVNGRIGVVALDMVPLRLPPTCIRLIIFHVYQCMRDVANIAEFIIVLPFFLLYTNLLGHESLCICGFKWLLEKCSADNKK